MLILDVTAVNVALPEHRRRPATSAGRALTWTVTAYTLCFGGLMLLGGRLADALGARRVMLAGLALFIAASAARVSRRTRPRCWAAGCPGRRRGAAVAGCPRDRHRPASTVPERDKALGIWAGLAGAGAALGNVLGGALTAGPGWRWVFYINVPVGILVLATLPAPGRGVDRARPRAGSTRPARCWSPAGTGGAHLRPGQGRRLRLGVGGDAASLLAAAARAVRGIRRLPSGEPLPRCWTCGCSPAARCSPARS